MSLSTDRNGAQRSKGKENGHNTQGLVQTVKFFLLKQQRGSVLLGTHQSSHQAGVSRKKSKVDGQVLGSLSGELKASLRIYYHEKLRSRVLPVGELHTLQGRNNGVFVEAHKSLGMSVKWDVTVPQTRRDLLL